MRQEDVSYRRGRDQVSDARTAMQDRMDSEKFGMMKAEFDLKKKLADQDMEDYATARGGLESFQNEYRAIPHDDPERVSKVTSLKLKYMPSIARNKSVAGQFQAIDSVEKQTAAWVNDSILKDQMQATLTEASRLNLGPEAMGIMKATQSGQMTIMDGLSQLQSAMSASRKGLADEEMQRQIKVRRAPYEARAEMAPQKLNEVERAELGDMVRERRDLRKAIQDQEKITSNTPDKTSSFWPFGGNPNPRRAEMEKKLAELKARDAELGNGIQRMNSRSSSQSATMSDRDGGGSAEPIPGDVVRGYEFLGGDPGNPKSWRLKP